MFTVYVLRSFKDQKLYVGCTSDLEKRFNEHNAGWVRSTKYRIPLSLIFCEEFIDKYEAFNQERYYKTAKGKKELMRKLKS